MTEPAVTRPVPARRRGGAGRTVLLLALLGALGFGAWTAARWALDRVHAVESQRELLARLESDLGALRAQSAALQARQVEIGDVLARQSAALEALGARAGATDQALGQLADTVDGGRVHVQLAAVEQLLLMASDRLQLARDAAGALKALELADQRLARLSDPRLHAVREALAQERATVSALVLPDVGGAAISLGRLLDEAPRWPLRVTIPEHFATPAIAEEPVVDGAWPRLLAAVRYALAHIFVLRRNDGPAPRLLSADEAALVAQVLQLKLEGARLALLALDGRSARELAGSARRWLAEYYDPRDPRVQVASNELARLASLEVAPAPPELGRTLGLLRARLDRGPSGGMK